ncbi:MAG: UDP-N-acetylglucosamine 1-carboxyvinyltransferase [Candidatus Woesebacteria bacterium]|jgi:UDP-N-acetylglucosamine 1-carboxyvinyltransferase
MNKSQVKSKQTLTVTGGTPLYGSVRLGGAKNASYKLMIATLLGDEKSRILNLPDIADVRMVMKIINELGAKAYTVGEKTIFFDPKGLKSHQVPKKYGEVSRASTLFLAPFLAKFGRAEVPLPGGDKIGKRPLERHLEGLVKMGVKWTLENSTLKAQTKGLRGVSYRFAKNTHTGTETLIMAAVLAKGKTVLENAAEEPEIDELINLLNKMGARIRRRSFRVIEIQGVKKLKGAIHRVMPDRNEAVSYAVAALATKGDIVIENARYNHLQSFLDKVDEAGGGVEIGDYGIRFFYKAPLRGTDIVTQIHPGFMTDWQPLWAILMCTAKGKSTIHETVMQNRFQYVGTLRKMGAKIDLFNPKITDPEKIYNFNWQDRKKTDQHAIRITGPTKFKGGEFEIHDLRAGATTLLAAIVGSGKTVLHNVEQIDRGYEKIDQKLASMGAKIIRT